MSRAHASSWLALTALLCAYSLISAAEPTKPASADVQVLEAHPTDITLRGGDDAQQFVVTAKLAGAKLLDLTHDCKYEVADTKVVRVTGSGRVIPVGNGSTEVTLSYGDKTLKVPVTAAKVGDDLPINFANQIVPILTKLGCNSGSCHGKASGQGGLKLSLFGFDPGMDHTALVRESLGRRLCLTAPDQSLLLLKATGTAAHGGGKRMEVGSDEYRLVRRWIAAGVPIGKPADPRVSRITIFPEQRVVPRHSRQQLAVYAHYSDGAVADITRRAQYESNELDIAGVDDEGSVRTDDLSGQAAIMARYQGHVATFRASVPLGRPVPAYQFDAKTVVDRHTLSQWKQLDLMPSDLCSDEVFIRRVHIDIAGTLPTPEQVKKFLASKDPAKRDKLIDALLETPEYSYYFANKWADILKVKRVKPETQRMERARGTFAFHGWIRDAIARDMPYDRFAREIITASGDNIRNPPSFWFKEVSQPASFVGNLGQVFLGLRLSCAECHHHPYEKWSQDDFWGIAAFVGRTGIKTTMLPSENGSGDPVRRQSVFTRIGPDTRLYIPRTGRTAVMHLLDGAPVQTQPEEDPRQKLVDWLVDVKNPYFARAVANRYWAHFFGRGIVDPLDDMRATNPPSNPELLDALARELTDHKYGLKHLVRIICKSRTYQLSAVPNGINQADRQTYARYYPKRMTAEVLFDAFHQVTGTTSTLVHTGNDFGLSGQPLPADRHAPTRAIMLPDESFASYFLDVFGRPERISPCECERGGESHLSQVLHLLNSKEVNGKVAAAGARAATLARDARPEEEKIEELFLWVFARKPTEKDMKLARAYIEKHADDKSIAYQDMLWALINSNEFLFNK
jgi:hypothetical protein